MTTLGGLPNALRDMIISMKNRRDSRHVKSPASWSKKDPRAKPRVTKKLTVFTSLVKISQPDKKIRNELV